MYINNVSKPIVFVFLMIFLITPTLNAQDMIPDKKQFSDSKERS